jgi:membrane protein implicated in regulation of membrane protease activity
MMQNEERIKEMLAAASMFDASVGGYVLVALISFAVAVAFTLLCIRWKQKNDQRDGPVNQRDGPLNQREGSVIETDTRDNSSVANDPQGESMTADGVQSVNRKID